MIGDNIRRTRKLFGITLAELAVRCKLSKGFMSQVETGRAQPSVASLQRIAQALDVSIETLMLAHVAGSRLQAAATQTSSQTPPVPSVWRTGVSYPMTQPLRSISAFDRGNALRVTLLPGSRLEGSSDVGSGSSATVFCFCQRGTTLFRQAEHTFRLNGGDVLEWDGATGYCLVNAGANPALLLLMWPEILPMPVVKVANVFAQLPHQPSRRRSLAQTGPFQLVEMRAERALARKR